MSSNSSASQNGLCPSIFLQESLFGNGGHVGGRFCTDLTPGLSCCIPCPATDWLYPDDFKTVTLAAEWINVLSTICSVFLLLSFLILPVAQTHRHYLSVALTISIIVMQLGFLIPLGAKPNQCYDAITPNDMHTSIVCALSGSFLILGGWMSLMWVCVRSMALHLQICWQVVIGRGFMLGSYAFSWGLPAIGVTVALIMSGVSFRFGDTCHLNHANSVADVWIPLLVFAGITFIIQCLTFGYCLKVYLASLNSSEPSSAATGCSLPTYTTSSIRTVLPKQAYRRVRRVLELQWRGICCATLILIDVVFFAVVFVYMDNEQQEALTSKTKAAPWIKCMVRGLGKDYCLQYAGEFVINETTVISVLVLLSFNGIWALLLLGRGAIYGGWCELIKDRLRKNRSRGDFVSVDAARLYGGRDVKSYEMIGYPGEDIKEPEPIARTASQLTVAPLSPFVVEPPVFSPMEQTSPISPPPKAGRQTPDYFGQEARYHPPAVSFSTPRPPSAPRPTSTGGPLARPLRSNPVAYTNPNAPPALNNQTTI